MAEKDNLKTLQRDFIICGGHMMSCNSILYIDKYRKVKREYFIFNTKKNYLKISNQGKQKKVCLCKCQLLKGPG